MGEIIAFDGRFKRHTAQPAGSEVTEPPTRRPVADECARCHTHHDVEDLYWCVDCEKRICLGCVSGRPLNYYYALCLHCSQERAEWQAGQDAIVQLARVRRLYASCRRGLIWAVLVAVCACGAALWGWLL